ERRVRAYIPYFAQTARNAKSAPNVRHNHCGVLHAEIVSKGCRQTSQRRATIRLQICTFNRSGAIGGVNTRNVYAEVNSYGGYRFFGKARAGGRAAVRTFAGHQREME